MCRSSKCYKKRGQTDKNHPTIWTWKFSRVEKWNVGNRLKRVLPKSEGCASHFRELNWRSKFCIHRRHDRKKGWKPTICPMGLWSTTLDVASAQLEHYRPNKSLRPSKDYDSISIFWRESNRPPGGKCNSIWTCGAGSGFFPKCWLHQIPLQIPLS